MRIVQKLKKEELKSILNEFYLYFKDGFEFENFLKPFLEKIGLSEVMITKKTRDDGVDLTAVKNGLADINNLDSVNYRIQAKRNAPNSTISPEKIDALRGNLKFNEKGLFITTAHVSKKAKEQAMMKDPSKPVIVIDGIDLIKICIEKQIGFAYIPKFSVSALDEFIALNDKNVIDKQNNVTEQNELHYVSKIITNNDIYCHLFSLPRYIFDSLDNNNKKQELNVIINGNNSYKLTYSPARKYLYINSASGILSKFNLIQDDGTIVEHEAQWGIDENNTIYINILQK